MPPKSADLGLVDALVQTSFLVQSVLAKAATCHELTVAQVRLLGILRDREPGTLQLAGHLGLDKSSVTGLISRAESRGLVRRMPDADDGRAIRVSTTTLGRRLTQQVDSEIDSQIRALGDVLTVAEQRTVGRLLSKILIAGETTIPIVPPAAQHRDARGRDRTSR
jgi:DNA-binding MarR family transcriptional regulator